MRLIALGADSGHAGHPWSPPPLHTRKDLLVRHPSPSSIPLCAGGPPRLPAEGAPPLIARRPMHVCVPATDPVGLPGTEDLAEAQRSGSQWDFRAPFPVSKCQV